MSVSIAVIAMFCAASCLSAYKAGRYYIAGFCGGYVLVVLATIVHHGIRGIG